MRIFWNEIGTRFPGGTVWPQACSGFLEFYRALNNPLEFGIISSGHDLFIEKCFEVWGIEIPKIVVTDDLMRSRRCDNFSQAERVKPGVGPFKIFCEEYKKLYAKNLNKDQVLYIGDSAKMDDDFARNCKISFILFNPNESDFKGKSISDWRELKEVILKK
ncbi:hypothetical protein CVV26_00855 [Candidatus Kuenenbacteria bacterium HGW-Kuenenbacteria-1]|uniref:HAD family hydrolase n=1 Tax=Candidatus Kuenenbacteria bacterium HGW-Kuenenbacteria-1 TaxID=2013812 RepID=A0A2N1UNV3_9BACT|nr:MAG: hypothetical protein CVV26_00855 [Candidatus Kuenenbacteria bacterium HGW-Kuenenbacteria-1]